jgi:hypothetical protein
MHTFIQKFAAKITGTLECFDRMIFKGHIKPMSGERAEPPRLAHQGLRPLRADPFGSSGPACHGLYFNEPERFPTGIEHVFVNGCQVVRHGAFTGVDKAGKVLYGGT